MTVEPRDTVPPFVRPVPTIVSAWPFSMARELPEATVRLLIVTGVFKFTSDPLLMVTSYVEPDGTPLSGTTSPDQLPAAFQRPPELPIHVSLV